MSRKKEYPGYLLYFDQMQGLVESCTDEELGMIHRAIFYYAQDRKEPEELPKEFRMVWPAIRRKLDEDRDAYEEKCRSAAYSATVKAAKAKGQPAPDRTLFDAMYNRGAGFTTRKLKEQEFEQMREEKLAMLENMPKSGRG